MTIKPVVTGIMFILVVVIIVYLVEFFVPLSAKADFDMLCRSALLRMENAGGLSDSEKQELRSELEDKGLSGIVINATENAGQGELLRLRVEADFSCSRLTGLFRREDVTIRMVYDKSAMSRKVVN